jgi:hypothetical protein
LGIDRPKHGMVAHYNFISRERDQRTARHGVVRHEGRYFSFSAVYGAGNLCRGQYETAGSVRYQVNWNIRVR